MRNLKEIANKLETSVEIIEAIYGLVEVQTRRDIFFIWEEPKDRYFDVLNEAFKNTEGDELHWGIETITREWFESEKIWVYDQSSSLAGLICHDDPFDSYSRLESDCTCYTAKNVGYCKFWLANTKITDSNLLFTAKVFRTVIEYFEGEIRNIRLGRKNES